MVVYSIVVFLVHAVDDVRSNRPREEDRFLTHHGDVASQPAGVVLTDVAIIQKDLSVGREVEALE